MPEPLHADPAQHFAALDAFLLQHQALWRAKPFTQLELDWEREHPELARWLRARSLEQAEQAHNHPEMLQAPEPFASLARLSAELSRVSELNERPLAANPRLSVDVPGRKWQQILAFAARLDFQTPAEAWLDWCAGKGHLGRLLASQGQPLTSLELDPALVEAGQRLSERHALTAEHRAQDVLAPDAGRHLLPQHSAVALHACGDLHVELIRQASRAGCRQLAIAPCCYNRIRGEHYRPLSAPAQASLLRPCLEDLRLPQTETVTAGARVRRQRDQSMAWRLAFDLLQRELRGQDDYLPTPSLPADWLHKPFANYCRDLAALKGLVEPGQQPWDELEQRGWQRLAQVRNLELLRGLFRRPMELWLLLDRALYLREQGYRVRYGTFCDSPLTPRNLLLLAER